jgi:hypothetical protein
MIEPFPWLKIIGVATRRCDECGIIFSRYTPQTMNYFLKMIAMLLLISVSILLFSSFLFNLFP